MGEGLSFCACCDGYPAEWVVFVVGLDCSGGVEVFADVSVSVIGGVIGCGSVVDGEKSSYSACALH